MSSNSPNVFLSYSHADEGLKERLAKHLSVLQDRLDVWDDRRLNAGDHWHAEIERAIQSADVAVLLISADFLSSDFILKEEVPRLLKHRQEDGVRIVPVLVKSCAWKEIPWLSAMQIRPTGARPVKSLEGDALDEALAMIATEILQLAEARQARNPAKSPDPSYSDAPSKELAEALETAYQQHEELMSTGGDASATLDTILDLKRRLRQEGQLKPGDYLAEGRYRLLEILGSGGFSVVFKAYDKQSRGLVAVKVLHAQYAQDKTRRDRFFRGARKMGELQHQGIVRVIEPEAKDEGYHYFVMEYVEGGDLRQAVKVGQIGVVDGLALLSEVAEALDLAHSRGVIHRDVKPANILLTAGGKAKLTDFDLVRALDTTAGTRTGSMLGTFLYMAPEAMMAAENADAAADVYSLAMCAAFVLHGEEIPATFMRDYEAFFEDLRVSDRMKETLRRATALKPGDRFGSALELTEALRQARGPAAAKPSKGQQAVRPPTPKPVEVPPNSGDTLVSWWRTWVVSWWRRLGSGHQSGLQDWVGDPNAEFAHLAIVFTAIINSSELLKNLKVAGWARVRSRYFDRTYELAKEYGGHVIKLSGDGHMIAFRSSIDALKFGVEFESHPGGVRVGIHVGQVQIDRGDAHGLVVRTAKRVMNVAVHGGVLVSRQVKDDCDFVFDGRRQPYSWVNLPDSEILGFPDQDSPWLVGYRSQDESLVGEDISRLTPEPLEAGVLAIQDPIGPPASRATWHSRSGRDTYGDWVSFEVGGVEQCLRWIPAGRVTKGSQEFKARWYEEETPSHKTTLARGFWLADTPCTQSLWEAVMGENPSRFQSPLRPVERVSWEDCWQFLERLNMQVRGLESRLPSEAEWEYACRAGSTTATWRGELEVVGENNAPSLDTIAWYGGNSGVEYDLKKGHDSSDWPEKQYPHTLAGTREVGQKLANPWGLYDMLGNVCEWCADGQLFGTERLEIPLQVDIRGMSHVIRGGSWYSYAQSVRASYRDIYEPGARYSYVGFRLALDP